MIIAVATDLPDFLVRNHAKIGACRPWLVHTTKLACFPVTLLQLSVPKQLCIEHSFHAVFTCAIASSARACKPVHRGALCWACFLQVHLCSCNLHFAKCATCTWVLECVAMILLPAQCTRELMRAAMTCAGLSMIRVEAALSTSHGPGNRSCQSMVRVCLLVCSLHPWPRLGLL